MPFDKAGACTVLRDRDLGWQRALSSACAVAKQSVDGTGGDHDKSGSRSPTSSEGAAPNRRAALGLQEALQKMKIEAAWENGFVSKLLRTI
eukprot:6178226-Pleurochrysis_carterae.AAC.7